MADRQPISRLLFQPFRLSRCLGQVANRYALDGAINLRAAAKGLFVAADLLLPAPKGPRISSITRVGSEACVRGVSTRRVEGLVEALGVASLSKSRVSEPARDLDEMVTDFRNRPLDAGPYTYVWADALTMKLREGAVLSKSSV